MITDNNGYDLEHDFFGHALTDIPEIGAAESDYVTVTATSNVYNVANDQISGLAKHTTVKELLKNLKIDSNAQVTVKSGDKVLAEMM